MYLLSAWPALALELGWTRLLVACTGSTSAALAAVLGGFMGGLGTGSFIAGRLVSRGIRAKQAFRWIQIAGAALCWIPLLAYTANSGSVAAVAAVFAASIPLGASFPVAVGLQGMAGGGPRATPGVMLGWDTAAGVLGCLAELAVVPSLGITGLAALSSFSKLVAAIIVTIIFGRATQERSPTPSSAGGKKSKVSIEAHLIVGCCGLSVMCAEIVWARVLPMVLFRGATVYATAAMLAAVLIGSSSGAWFGARLSRKARYAIRLAFVFLALLALGLLWSLFVLQTGHPAEEGIPIGAWDIFQCLLACLPAPFFSAAAFALAAAGKENSEASSRAGRLFGTNCLGAVLGAVLGYLFVVPALGLAGSLAACALLCCCLVVVAGKRAGSFVLRITAAAATIFLIMILLASGPRWARNLGMVEFYREGREATVAVVRLENGARRILVDAQAVAGDDLAMLTDQYLLAHLPLALRPRARRALTVGFGSGTTSRAMLDHDGVRVTCVEIEPEVVAAAMSFSELNRGLPQKGHERFTLVIDDARHFLRVSGQRYDVIVNDCTDFAFRSNAMLYTREFFRLVASRLAEGGLVAAWVPLRGQPPWNSLRAVLAAFCDVFPYASLWVFDNAPVHFGILTGSNSPLGVDLAALRKMLRKPPIQSRLEGIGLADAARIAVSRHFDGQALRAIAAGATPNSDLRPVVEYTAPLEGGDDFSAYRFLQLHPPSGPPRLIPDSGAAALEKISRRLRLRPLLLAGHGALAEGDERLARFFFMTALKLDPGSKGAA
ncbi:MAG: hypothetical protein D6806_09865, partial [Deltaproteobacteria bacterium]